MKRRFTAALVFVLAGCAGVTIQQRTADDTPLKALRRAQAFLKEKPFWRVDCSNFVRACYDYPPLETFLRKKTGDRNLTYYLFEFFRTVGVARGKNHVKPGDVVFFHKTYDQNHDGSIDERDRFTHVGIVESLSSGRLTYLDASLSRQRRGEAVLQRRVVHLFGGSSDETVARDPKTGTPIRHSETVGEIFGLF